MVFARSRRNAYFFVCSVKQRGHAQGFRCFLRSWCSHSRNTFLYTGWLYSTRATPVTAQLFLIDSELLAALGVHNRGNAYFLCFLLKRRGNAQAGTYQARCSSMLQHVAGTQVQYCTALRPRGTPWREGVQQGAKLIGSPFIHGEIRVCWHLWGNYWVD